jgi:predicted SnoaL-like aldol condensation-catalyzing enzyme
LLSSRTFKIEPVSVTPFGDELVVTHTRNTMIFEDQPITLDAIVVWRVVDGRLAEAWDIPSVYSAAKPQ